MHPLSHFIDRYVAQWNEPDPAERRSRIAALWTEDAMTCHRLQVWRGLKEIEARVDGAYDKWVAQERSPFRATGAVASCGEAVRFLWVMARADTGEVRSVGCNYLILAPDGRIRQEYQFLEPSPPASEELTAFMARYLETWNAPLARRREESVRALWAEDGRHLSSSYELAGHEQVIAEAHGSFVEYGGRGLEFQVHAGLDGHHGAIRFDWRLVPHGGGAVEHRGAGLLILNEAGRIAADYQFEPFPDRSATAAVEKGE
jgi:hypothetical protein